MRSLRIPALAALLCAAAAPAAPDSAGAPDTAAAITTEGPEPAWFRPAGEMLGMNLGLWAYNRYVADYAFARISPSTMIDNLGGGWVWDEDQFSINQFGHPYQGSFYYSSARYHRHGFYASTAYTLLGSLQWEYFMEAESPSYNDLVTTTLGGAMLGEISFRLSNALLDPSAGGVERVAREIGSAAVNPVNGLNRLIAGKTFAGGTSAPPDRQRSRASTGLVGNDLLLRVSTGGVVPYFSTAEGEERATRQHLPRANTEFLVIHGDGFEARAPYDYFLINLGINVLGSPVSTVSARAQLHRVEIYRSARQRGQLILGQNFDYLDNGIYKLGVSGFGGGYAHIRNWGRSWYHTLHIQLGVIPLGGVSSEFFQTGHRDYNLGGGAYSHARLVLGRGDAWHAAVVSDRYWLHTRSGAKGDELIGHSRTELAHRLYRSLGLALSLGAYDRTARSRDHGTRAELTQEGRLLLTLGFH